MLILWRYSHKFRLLQIQVITMYHGNPKVPVRPNVFTIDMAEHFDEAEFRAELPDEMDTEEKDDEVNERRRDIMDDLELEREELQREEDDNHPKWHVNLDGSEFLNPHMETLLFDDAFFARTAQFLRNGHGTGNTADPPGQAPIGLDDLLHDEDERMISLRLKALSFSLFQKALYLQYIECQMDLEHNTVEKGFAEPSVTLRSVMETFKSIGRLRADGRVYNFLGKWSYFLFGETLADRMLKLCEEIESYLPQSMVVAAGLLLNNFRNTTRILEHVQNKLVHPVAHDVGPLGNQESDMLRRSDFLMENICEYNWLAEEALMREERNNMPGGRQPDVFRNPNRA